MTSYHKQGGTSRSLVGPTVTSSISFWVEGETNLSRGDWAAILNQLQKLHTRIDELEARLKERDRTS